MKLFAPVAAVLAAGGTFALVIERDFATVTDVLSGVQSNIDNLDNAIKVFNADDPSAVAEASGKLVTAIQSGETKVKGSGNLSSSVAINLVHPVQTFKQHAQALTVDLKAQKDAIQQANLCDLTRIQISNINTTSQSLLKTMISNVPQSLQSTANHLSQGIIDTLNDAQNACSTSNCQDVA